MVRAVHPLHERIDAELNGVAQVERLAFVAVDGRIVRDIYERYFSACGFDGVFLDKIRGQSFVSGVSGVLSCGCGRCGKAFLEFSSPEAQ